MQDEYLERIEAKLDRVIKTQEEHTARLDDHSQRFDQIDTRFGQIDTRFGQIDTRLTRIDTRLERVDNRLAGIDTRLTTAELTLENTLPQAIKQIAEGHAMLQQQMDRGFADMKKHIDTRLGPFEEAVRQHSAKLNQLT